MRTFSNLARSGARDAVRSMLLSGLALALAAFAAETKPADAKKEPAKGATNSAPKALVIPKSVFVEDPNPRNGKDPFFPDSVRRLPVAAEPVKPSRPGTTNATAKPVVVVPVKKNPSLVLQGISGSQNLRLATINGRNFEQGESVVVRTPEGMVRVTCVEILARSVIIRVEGDSERKELKLRGE